MAHRGHGCAGDHQHDETPEMGVQYSLYTKIDKENLTCLNESEEGSGKLVFKAWEDRLDFSKKDKCNLTWRQNALGGPDVSSTIFEGMSFKICVPIMFVESDGDDELLFNIPFTGNVKLKGIVLIGGEDESHPNKMRLFKNRPHMTFDDARTKADQEFELHPDPQGMLEYSTKVVAFSSVYHLSIHFPSSRGGDMSKVYYIGLRGEYSEGHRHGVTICTYESRPNVADHKTNLMDNVSHQIQ